MTDLLNVNDLKVEFHLTEGVVRAVNGVSFRVPAGKTVALVGESGSGKSVVSQTIMGILPKQAKIAGGEVLFNDPRNDTVTDLLTLDREGPDMRALRGGRISIIFQEPMTSLSPLHTVGDQVSEALFLHSDVTKAEGTELGGSTTSDGTNSGKKKRHAERPGATRQTKRKTNKPKRATETKRNKRDKRNHGVLQCDKRNNGVLQRDT